MKVQNLDKNTQAFFALLRAGLWEQEVRLFPYEEIDFIKVFMNAKEQTVVGLVAAGLEHVSNVKIPNEIILSYVGDVLQLEQQNKRMNEFVAKLFQTLYNNDVNVLLVKGQGIAQCYERPLWRACGDVDLLMSRGNYEKAKEILLPMAIYVEQEYTMQKHLGMMMEEGFEVELHGTLHTRLSKRIDRYLDSLQEDMIMNNKVRVWQNDNTDVQIPSPDYDVVFLFTHILHHFYIEGIGLRQICDLCRFLWTFKDSLDINMLESRLRIIGLMSEWKVFAALSVDWLGLPSETMPLYSASNCWSRKALRVIDYIMETGNFGRNRIHDSPPSMGYLSRKVSSLSRKSRDFFRHILVFPLDSICFLIHFVVDGLLNTARETK